jgi:type III secretion protein D
MYELRILSGLHRGATLPLEDEALAIGAGDDSDVVLVDPDIKQHHATLSRTDTGWLLSAAEGLLYSADSNQPQSLIDLAEGDFVRLGTIWMSVVPQDSRWEDPPPEPVDSSFADEMALSATAEMEESRTAETTDSADAGEPVAVETSKAPAGRRRRMLLIPLAMVTVLSAAAAYAITSKPVSSLPTARLDVPEQVQQGDVVGQSAGTAELAPSVKAVDTKANANASADTKIKTAKAPVLTQEEMRKSFRKRLEDAQLLRQFDLSLDDDSWTMRASLDNDETKRFERILVGFMHENNITFPVNAKIVNSAGMLPFKIRQVITGPNAGIVTQDGERLYIGDEYRGIRMVAVRDNHLTFAGKRKIEVNW